MSNIDHAQRRAMRPVPEAVEAAKRYVTESMHAAFPAGRGHGPLNHLHEWWARLPAR
jgi:hydroxymethylpyrimidine/phosphomethylpyrimidine kinase